MSKRMRHIAGRTALLLAVLLLAFVPHLAWATQTTATITAKARFFQEYKVSVSGLQNTFEYVIEPVEEGAPLPVDEDGKTLNSFALTRDDDIWLEFPVEVAVDPSASPYTYHYMIRPKQTELSDGLYYVDVLSTSLSAGVNEYPLEIHVQPSNTDAAVSIVVPTVHVAEWDGPKVTDPGWRVSYKEPEEERSEAEEQGQETKSSDKNADSNPTSSPASKSSTTSGSASTSRTPLSTTGDPLASVTVLASIAFAGAFLVVYAFLRRRRAGDDHA